MAAVLAFLIGSMMMGSAPLGSDTSDGPDLPDIPWDDMADNAAPDRRSRDDESVGMMRGVEVTIQRRVIVRIPMLPLAADPPAPPPDEERRGIAPPLRLLQDREPSCLALRSLRGASVHDRGGIVFVTTQGSNYKAVLERGCRQIDFQSGFYLDPAPDGAICAGRDLLHARSGASCTVTGFSRVKQRADGR